MTPDMEPTPPNTANLRHNRARRAASRAALAVVATTLTGAALWSAHATGDALGGAVGGAATAMAGPERVPEVLVQGAAGAAEAQAGMERKVSVANHELGLYLSDVLPGEWEAHSPEGAIACGCAVCCGIVEDAPGGPAQDGIEGEFAPVEDRIAASQGPTEAATERSSGIL